jgi:hypothetical protein
MHRIRLTSQLSHGLPLESNIPEEGDAPIRTAIPTGAREDCPAITSPDDLNRVNETVESYFSDWAEPGRYVVSDCDIDMSIADPRALDVFEELLNKFRRIDCVGPMLRIRDIPRSYPLFNRVMNRHIEQFWMRMPTFEETSFGQIAILDTQIDTTFALHRAGEPFRRLKSALRVYEPFEALHLDWYATEGNDSLYSESSSSEISHWNNKAERARYGDTALEYSHFYAVRRVRSELLEIYEEYI